jgi:uncharacterized protein YciI
MAPSFRLLALALGLCLATATARADDTAAKAPASPYDEALAQRTGADERGMRPYVLVILKSGSTPVPKGEARDAMFRGHFANMERLAKEGKLAFAGPLDGVDGWRGLFVLATDDLEQARAWVATDPVVAQGEMVPELHKLYGSAALMLVNDHHAKLQPPKPAD